MTSGNLAATQNLFRIWNSREFEALIPFVTQDIEWTPATMKAVEGGSFHGVDGLRRFFDEWDKAWTTWEVDPQEVRELGSQVLVLGHVRAEGRGSGLVLDQPVAYLFEFRDGLLARGQTFFDHDEAVAAASERAQGEDESGVPA
jgi:ketosteroid isomerase-like protein